MAERSDEQPRAIGVPENVIRARGIDGERDEPSDQARVGRLRKKLARRIAEARRRNFQRVG